MFDGGVNLTKGYPPAPPKNCPISHVQKPLTVQQAVGTRALAPFPFPELASLLDYSFFVVAFVCRQKIASFAGVLFPAPCPEETAFRYLPYLARAKRLLIASQRYIAYSSDVGESLRPVLKNWQVNLTYGIAGAYIVVDTGLAGYRKYKQNSSREHIAGAVAHTAVFQSIASLALPAVIIHTVVHQTSHFLDKPRFKQHAQLVRYGPSVVGLGLIPLMPLLDHPCEHAIDFLFDHFWPTWRAR
ncbi:unnamed protein product [Effrenium voratum]|nr:unnamed protein product [Effrenium voratum]